MDVRSISAERQLMSKHTSIGAYSAKPISLFGTCYLLPVLKLREIHPYCSVTVHLRELRAPQGRRLLSPPLCLMLRKVALDIRCNLHM
jgi:hypothetical protein